MNAITGTPDLELPRHRLVEPPARAADDLRWEGRFHLLMAGSAIAVVAISLFGYFYCRLSATAGAVLPFALILLGVLIVAMQYRWRREHKCFQIVMMVFWMVMVTNCHFFPMYMAARTNVGLNDALLAQCDRA